MRKAALALLILISVVAALLGATVAAVWLFPASVVQMAARAARPHGIDLAATAVHGTPGAGWAIDGLSVGGPGFDLSARKLRVDVAWASTFSGRPALDVLWADGLRVDVRPSTSTVKKPKSDAAPRLLPVADLRINDGKITVEKSGAEPFVVSGVDLEATMTAERADVKNLRATVMDNRLAARGHYEPAERTGGLTARVLGCLAAPGLPPGRCIDGLNLSAEVKGDDVELKHVGAFIQGSTVTGRGQFHLKPMNARLTLASQGPLAIKADVRGSEKRWNFEATGNHKTSRFNAGGGIDLVTEVWSASMSAVGIPADLVPGLPRSLGALSGSVIAGGRGTSPSTLNGSGRADIVASNGPRLKADLSISNGDVRAAVAVSSGGIDGSVKTAWNLDRKAGEVAADLSLEGKGLRRWLPFGADGPVTFELKGPQAALAWTVNADLRAVELPAASIKTLSVQGAGPSLAPPDGRVTISVRDVDRGGQKIEKAGLTVDGRLTRHAFDLALSREGASLEAAGHGSVENAVWRSTWTRLEAELGQTWQLDGPFGVTAGAKRSAIHGFHLVSEASGSLRLNGVLAGERLEGVMVAARGLQLEGLAKLSGLETPVSGTASLDATASGPVSRPTAAVSARIAGLSIDNRPAGDVDLAARLANGRVLIERLDLVTKGGTLNASADLPVSFAGRKAPPFTVRLRTTGLDLAALPVPLGEWKFDKANLKGDLTLSGKGGDFSASGRLDFTADRIGTDEKKGTEIREVRVQLVGDGASLRVAEATAKGGDGTVAISGSVARSRADLAFTARSFELRYPAGVYLKFNSDMTLQGPWEAPHVDGRVDIAKGEIKPAKEKKEKGKKAKKAPEEKPAAAGASPVSANVSVSFDRDVWYRDGQSAIELKGDLKVRKESGGPALTFGTVETIRGNYYFYGRAFTIEEGRVTFSGEIPMDPQLTLRATYQNEANRVKIIIDASGTLNDPRIALSSEPPMEETDIISVLVTGSPLGAEREGNGSEALARTMAANYLADKVRQQVQDRIAIDVLQFNLAEGGGADLTIGDRVTKDLYLSYGQTLGSEAERRVNAEYELTPHFSLNGQTSNLGRYVLDLLFKFGFY